MSQTDRAEYGTGTNPNPFDQAADIPRKDDWQARLLQSRQEATEGAPWYPVAQGPPETQLPRRYRAFQVDEGDFQASVSPQKWDCTPNIFVPQNDGLHGNPVELAPALPGRSSLTIMNTGSNAISLIISPTLEKALAGIGIIVPAGASFQVDCQAGAYAWGINGNSTAQVMWTYFEAPTTHLPPKDKD